MAAETFRRRVLRSLPSPLVARSAAARARFCPSCSGAQRGVKGRGYTVKCDYRGVSFSRGMWRAKIDYYTGKGSRRSTRNLGAFTDPLKAARAYDAAARQLHGDRARLNFPVEQPGCAPHPNHLRASPMPRRYVPARPHQSPVSSPCLSQRGSPSQAAETSCCRAEARPSGRAAGLR